MEAWVEAFAQGKRVPAEKEQLCPAIQLRPDRLGYRLFLSEEAFSGTYPAPFEAPDSFPVFAKAIVAAGQVGERFSGKVVLSYLYMRDVTVVDN